MMFRILGTLALALMISTSAFAAKTVRFGHAMPDSHPQAIAANKFAELVGKYTDGRYKVDVYHNAQLGSDEKQIQGVQSGVQQFYCGTLASFATRVPEVQVWDIPFAYANSGEIYALYDGPSAQEIFKKMEKIGVKGIVWTAMGFRNVSNSKRPVTKLEDIDGLKIRVMTNPIALETWKTLGANAVPMAFNEVFTALETKTIDGQENPLQHMFANKMQEVQDYVSLTNHVYTAVALIASKRFWDKLSDADKAAFQKAGEEAGLLQRQLLDDGDKDAVKKFEDAGVKVNAVSPEELARIRATVQPVADKFKSIVGEEFYGKFFKELEDYRAKNK